MLIKILAVLVAVLTVLTLVIALQPAAFQITRSAAMEASAAKIFGHVNNLRQWHDWSPWAKIDPNTVVTFTGSDEGMGATMRWESAMDEVGIGQMTITESQPSDMIQLQLDFEKPFKGTNSTEFTFKPEGDKTLVTWTMKGTNNFVGKAMSLVFNCDKMVGGRFEQGLAQLQALVEVR